MGPRGASLALWLAGLLLAAGAQDDLGLSLRRKLNESLAPGAIRYSAFNASGARYNASTRFNPKGMGQLYNVTNAFIDFVQPKQAYPEGMLYLVDGKPRLADPAVEWRKIAEHYGGLAGLGLAGLLLAALLPCIGLLFCCCRCAGRCGARSEPFDKKHDHCRKVMLSFLLIGFATILLFGVVCAFATNEYMQDGTRELPQAAKTSLGDVRLYLATTKAHISSLLIRNYKELERALQNILQAAGKIVSEMLAESTHAVSLMNLNDIVVGLESIRADLATMNTITRDLRNNASNLATFVRKVKGNLLQMLTSCDNQECKEAMHKYKIDIMKVEVDFDKLPDTEVTQALNNLSQLVDDNIVAEVSKGMEQFMNIQKEIQQAVNGTIPIVNESIRKAGQSLGEIESKISQLIDRLNADIDSKYMWQLDQAKQHIDQYSPYRYYLGLGISGILLTVLSCLTFGLFCGICGKRPDGFGDDCCNKGSGARFLMMAVWIIFLLTSILMIITVAHMISGVLVQRAICDPLKDPNDNRMFEFVDEYLQIKRLLYPKNPEADINMSHILNSCHRNETIYNVLKLQYIIDVDSLRNYIYSYNINQTIEELEQKISLSHSYTIISPQARKKLNALAESGLSDLKFYQYTENLKDNITNVDLEQLATRLRELASRLPNSYEKNYLAIKRDLIGYANDLENYHRNIVIPMVNWSGQLSDSAMRLQEHIKFNHTSMADAIHSLVAEVDKAQKFITESGPEHVKVLAAEFGKAFINHVSDYLDHIIYTTRNEVGLCGPLSNAYNATIVASCNKILDPFNGFWASVGWCLILFIPTIVLCVKLSALYQKSDPYPGPLVDAIHDKKYAGHSRHHPGYPERYDGPAHGYSDRERISEAHQSSSHHDSRYSDLAPNLSITKRLHQAQAAPTANQNNSTKVFSISLGRNAQNWDFPNGGPPRYQPAAVAPPLSAEYERPPPYYYPGPGDRN